MHRKLIRLRSVAILAGILLVLLAACAAPATDETPTEAAAPTATAPTEENTEAEPATDPAAESTAGDSPQTDAADAQEDVLPTITPTPAAETEAETEGNDEAAAPTAPTFNPEQDSLALRSAYTGFNQPLFVTHAGDDSNRLFVVEKTGRIQVIQAGETTPSVFLDLTDRVRSSGNEQGLLGLAFPPNFGETGHFFVNYTDSAGDTVIARFQVQADNPNQADAASELVILQQPQPASNHNGGMLTFGPDGYLWIGMGDGGAANNRFGTAMDPQSLLGKMLRIDVTSNPDQPYTIPADNPWVETDLNGADVMDEIWAIGLRNPWRYSFDRATGDLWIADVGQNQYEEVNLTPADSPGGLNYGWSIMEGTHCFEQQGCDTSGLVLPVIEYSHGPHCSVTGGYVYRGSEFPALNGVYVYGDYCSGMIWTGVPNADGTVAAYPALQSNLTLSSFGENEAGELFATDLNGGEVYQVVIE